MECLNQDRRYKPICLLGYHVYAAAVDDGEYVGNVLCCFTTKLQYQHSVAVNIKQYQKALSWGIIGCLFGRRIFDGGRPTDKGEKIFCPMDKFVYLMEHSNQPPGKDCKIIQWKELVEPKPDDLWSAVMVLIDKEEIPF